MIDMRHENTCQASLVTAGGRSAVATVRVTGVDARRTVAKWFRPATGTPFEQRPLGTIIFGRWNCEGSVGEELVLCCHSETRIDLHCHGGAAAAEMILTSLEATQCPRTDWRNMVASDRALEGAAEVELARADTQRTAAILLDQYRGALRERITKIRSSFQSGDEQAAGRMLDDLLRFAPVGRHLVRPWRVVLCGAPNAGKSSLINAILGYERSIVFDRPGTTRDVVRAKTAIHGWPIELSDTAGLREATDQLEQAGIERAERQIAEADLVLHLVDLSAPNESMSPNVMSMIHHAESKRLTIGSKSDLVDELARPSLPLRCSALTGQAIEQLVDAISQFLVPCPPSAGDAVPFTQFQIEHLRKARELCSEDKRAEATECLSRILHGSGVPESL